MPPSADASAPIRIALAGIGKIARDQHLPVIAASPDFTLAAAVSGHAELDDAPTFKTLDALLKSGPAVDAVVLSGLPDKRYDEARTVLEAGLPVFLEKPPGVTLSEVEDLRALAADRRLTLFASWHSRCAPGVEPARAWLAGRRVTSARIQWREDVRRWHPGQDWIWAPGGLGVFDPGINALSIATRILPRPFHLKQAELRVPQNRQSPIAAELAFVDAGGAAIAMSLDWLQTGPQTWEVRVETDDGALVLAEGGAKLSIAGEDRALEGAGDPHVEYAGLYRRFAQLVRAGESEVDVSPLRHAADAFLLGRPGGGGALRGRAAPADQAPAAGQALVAAPAADALDLGLHARLHDLGQVLVQPALQHGAQQLAHHVLQRAAVGGHGDGLGQLAEVAGGGLHHVGADQRLLRRHGRGHGR